MDMKSPNIPIERFPLIQSAVQEPVINSWLRFRQMSTEGSTATGLALYSMYSRLALFVDSKFTDCAVFVDILPAFRPAEVARFNIQQELDTSSLRSVQCQH